VTLITSFLGTIYYACTRTPLYINQYTKFEFPSFTNYEDMIRAKF